MWDIFGPPIRAQESQSHTPTTSLPSHNGIPKPATPTTSNKITKGADSLAESLAEYREIRHNGLPKPATPSTTNEITKGADSLAESLAEYREERQRNFATAMNNLVTNLKSRRATCEGRFEPGLDNQDIKIAIGAIKKEPTYWSRIKELENVLEEARKVKLLRKNSQKSEREEMHKQTSKVIAQLEKIRDRGQGDWKG